MKPRKKCYFRLLFSAKGKVNDADGSFVINFDMFTNTRYTLMSVETVGFNNVHAEEYVYIQ